MKKIIVPVDFSKHSEYAIESAAILAKRNNSEILAVHMLELSETSFSQSDSNNQLNDLFIMKRAEQQFEDFLNKKFLEGVKVTPIIKRFKVFRELNEIAKSEHADLVIMGSHGTSGMSEIFIGSNTERVVRHSDISVSN